MAPQASKPVPLAQGKPDWAWVGASTAVVALRPFGLSSLGAWLIADLALVVAGFAIAQTIGLRRATVSA